MYKISEKIKNYKKVLSDFFKINPHRHWSFLLNLFIVISLILVFFSIYLLYQIKSEKIFQVELKAKDTKSLLEEDVLDRIINIFDQKNQKSINIEKNPPQYVDPSI